MEAFVRGKVTVAELGKWHGQEAFFRDCTYRMFPATRTLSPAYLLLMAGIFGAYAPRLDQLLENRLIELAAAGSLLLTLPPPWLREGKTPGPHLSTWMFDADRYSKRFREPPELDCDKLFGAFAVLALMLEGTSRTIDLREIKEEIRRSRLQFFNKMRWLFLARFEDVKIDGVQEEMDRCGFSVEQRTFALAWIGKKFNLINSSASGPELE